MRTFPRMPARGLTARIEKAAVPVLPDFRHHCPQTGNIPERDMFNTFNMGVGMVLAVVPGGGGRRRWQSATSQRRDAYTAGRDRPGERNGVVLCSKTRIAVLVSGGGTNLQALFWMPETRGRSPHGTDRAGGLQQPQMPMPWSGLKTPACPAAVLATRAAAAGGL